MIKTIDLGSIERRLKELVGLSFQTKLFQEEYLDVEEQIKTNKKELSSGNISSDVFRKNNAVLEKERKRMASRINENVKTMQAITKQMSKVVEANKI